VRDRMLRSMFAWGALWLTIGLFLEPAEGGIKKVPETLTYFFSVTGVTSLLLVAMTVITDGIERRGWVHALIDVGQNPLLGYVLFTVLLNPLLELIPPLRPVLMSSPAESVIRSLIETVMVVVAVRFVTHRRVFWRT
jgi:predicted acyltransferase